MKKQIIFIFLFISIIFNTIYSKENYIDDKLGIKFTIPEDVIYKKAVVYNKFNVSVINYDQFKDYGYERNSSEIKKIEASIINNKPANIYGPPSIFLEFKNIDNIKGIVDFNMGYDIYDAIIEKRFFFVKNGSLISICISYELGQLKDSDEKKSKDRLKIVQLIDKYNVLLRNNKMPRNEEYLLSEISKNIYAYIYKNKKPPIEIPEEMIKLYKYFDELTATIHFYEPKEDKKDTNKKYYAPKVAALRLRESPTLDGKFIRSLLKGEKLELIEKGKEEMISGVKGNWVKVRTEKGEIGWCFSGYLEELK